MAILLIDVTWNTVTSKRLFIFSISNSHEESVHKRIGTKPISTYLASDDLNFSWASRAARASSSSYRLQLYQEEPWGSHDPKHTQQKSYLQFWFLQTYDEIRKKNTMLNNYHFRCKTKPLTIWLQPPSFSIVTLHFGHSLVLAAIQLDVSESSSHFFIHFLSSRHWTGSCQFSPHSKQNTWLHLQITGRASTYCTLMA